MDHTLIKNEFFFETNIKGISLFDAIHQLISVIVIGNKSKSKNKALILRVKTLFWKIFKTLKVFQSCIDTYYKQGISPLT